MRFDCETFGPYLRHERERRGISLDDISSRTKIARAHLANLERGNVDGWPAGIFRRSFFRDYVNAIGLDPDDLMEEFQRLFPDGSAAARTFAERPGAPPPAGSELRLTLDAAPAVAAVPAARMKTAAIDTASILVAAIIVAAIVGHVALVTAALALVYHAAATIWSDLTPGALLTRGPRVEAAATPAAPVLARAPRIEARRTERARRPRGHRHVIDASSAHGSRLMS